jgi:hypothetical protein
MGELLPYPYQSQLDGKETAEITRAKRAMLAHMEADR